MLEYKIFFENYLVSQYFQNHQRCDKFVTRCLLSVAHSGWFLQKDWLKFWKQNISVFFKSAMNDIKEWDGKTYIFIQWYFDILQHFDFSFYLREILWALLKAKQLFKIIQTKIITLVTVPKMWKNFRIL